MLKLVSSKIFAFISQRIQSQGLLLLFGVLILFPLEIIRFVYPFTTFSRINPYILKLLVILIVISYFSWDLGFDCHLQVLIRVWEWICWVLCGMVIESFLNSSQISCSDYVIRSISNQGVWIFQEGCWKVIYFI